MSNVWDYKLRKLEMAWTIANSSIPPTGEADYVPNLKAALQASTKLVDDIFNNENHGAATLTK